MKKKSPYSNLKSKLTVATTGEFKTIELTDEQYERLMILIKIGLRMVHGSNDNDFNVPMIDIDQYLSSYVKQFNAENLIELNETFGGLYFCTEYINRKIDITQGRYLDHYLYTQLSEKLATRELYINIMNKPTTKPLKTLEELQSDYLKEFEENGLRNIRLAEQKTND